MGIWARGLMITLALAACTTGETQVQGGGTGEQTGATATGPTATAPTGPTAATGDGFAGAVSLDIPAAQNATGATAYSCDGVEGTWTYEAGEFPVQGIEMTIEAAPFSMEGGDGTLVIEGTLVIPGAGEAGFVDTVDLQIQGTAEAPTMTSTSVQVDFSGAIEGFPIDFAQFFPENTSFPIVPGAEQC